uniref:Uncharacterized protein n=1 Tax=Anguilla anguilla TaxID=7936 RepID=A0A0E9VLA6_ANGAN
MELLHQSTVQLMEADYSAAAQAEQ